MEKKNSLLKDIIEILIGAAIISLILVNFILKPYKVNGTSMHPTLKDGDFGYSFIITKKLGINRFDTVVIEVNTTDVEKLLVKRVIGMPNETVEIKNNKLFINGEYIEQTFIKPDVYTEDLYYVLGEDEYYCLGDNRPVSRDSRYYGPFLEKDIISTHLLVLWPITSFGVQK